VQLAREHFVADVDELQRQRPLHLALVRPLQFLASDVERRRVDAVDDGGDGLCQSGPRAAWVL